MGLLIEHILTLKPIILLKLIIKTEIKVINFFLSLIKCKKNFFSILIRKKSVFNKYCLLIFSGSLISQIFKKNYLLVKKNNAY